MGIGGVNGDGVRAIHGCKLNEGAISDHKFVFGEWMRMTQHIGIGDTMGKFG